MARYCHLMTKLINLFSLLLIQLCQLVWKAFFQQFIPQTLLLRPLKRIKFSFPIFSHLCSLQINTTLSIEYLMDTAVECMKEKNKVVTSDTIDAMCSFCMHYSELKEYVWVLYSLFCHNSFKAPPQWFKIPAWVKQNPDFFILYFSLSLILWQFVVCRNETLLGDIVEKKLWVEWMILRQYHALFVEVFTFQLFFVVIF